MARLLVVNGPNLNLLGRREPEIYGADGLDAIMAGLARRAEAAGHVLEAFHSNSEGALIDRIQRAADDADYILINAASYTHTSIGIRDALLAAAVPYIEVHLSNVHAREAFRHRSFLADRAVGVICGFGPQSYTLALDAALARLDAAPA